MQQQQVRLDKWLWAARFYKTRAIAKAAIEGGKVHYDKLRVKPGKLVQVGATLQLRIGYDEREIVVTALSDKRGPASEAQQLYYETEASIERRRAAAQMRKAAGIQPQRKPDKKQRRQIHRFKRIFDEN